MRQIRVILIIFLGTIVRAEIINIPADFETIQEGIDAAADGDTVVVAPGEYFETLSVNKGIVLASQYIFNPDTSIISQTIMAVVFTLGIPVVIPSMGTLSQTMMRV